MSEGSLKILVCGDKVKRAGEEDSNYGGIGLIAKISSVLGPLFPYEVAGLALEKMFASFSKFIALGCFKWPLQFGETSFSPGKSAVAGSSYLTEIRPSLR